MDVSGLEAKLREWTTEFKSISQLAMEIPDEYFAFVSNRLAEIGEIREDPDVVSARIGGISRRVRVTGLCGDQMKVQSVEGYLHALCRPDDVNPDDRGKLNDILVRLSGGG
jgi:hypothetical protein